MNIQDNFTQFPTVESIQSLEIKDGDVVVVSVDTYQNIQFLADVLGQVFAGTKNQVFIHDQSITVEKFSEEQMNAAGWYRK